MSADRVSAFRGLASHIAMLSVIALVCVCARVEAAADSYRSILEFGHTGKAETRLFNPWRLAFNTEADELAIADAGNHRIVIFNDKGERLRSIEGPVDAQLPIGTPCGVAYSRLNGLLYVSDVENHRILVFKPTGEFQRSIGGRGSQPGAFEKPTGIAIDSAGVVYVADSGNSRVQALSANGEFLYALALGNSKGQLAATPYDVALSADGLWLAVADYNANSFAVIKRTSSQPTPDSAGQGQRFDITTVRHLGRSGRQFGEFNGPSGLSFDSEGRLYVADSINKRIQWFDLNPGGRQGGQFGSGGDGPEQFIQAHAVAVHPKTGDIYITDYYQSRVKVFSHHPAPAAKWLSAYALSLLVLLACSLALLIHHRLAHRTQGLQTPISRALATALWRPKVSQGAIRLATAAWTTAVLNGPLWSEFAQWSADSPSGPRLQQVPVFLALLAVNYLLLSCVAFGRLTKAVCIAFVVLAALAAHFMSNFGIYLDPTMLANVFATHLAEAREHFGRGLLTSLVQLAGPPVLLLAFLRTDASAPARRHSRKLGLSMLALLMVCVVLGQSAIRTAFAGNPLIVFLVNPVAGLGSAAAVLARRVLPAGQADATDSAGDKRVASEGRPRLVVFVLGESTRAKDWGRLPDGTDTTPQLALTTAINFTDVRSCNTNTLSSVPCIFSAYGRRQVEEDRSRGPKGLLQMLQRLDVETAWIGNQENCLGVCNGVRSRFLPTVAGSGCENEGCLDERLIGELEATLAQQTPSGPAGKQASRYIVLHLAGSHGPAYFRRYPEAFARFQPDCRTDELQQCAIDDVRRAYRNSVLYTDHVIARVIETLKKQSTYDSALIFTSDHGESLGEGGRLMHGTPYAIAPREQIEVPLLLWLSPSLSASAGVDTDCVSRKARDKTGHEAIFQTTLGLFQVQSRSYQAALDLTAGCRPAT